MSLHTHNLTNGERKRKRRAPSPFTTTTTTKKSKAAPESTEGGGGEEEDIETRVMRASIQQRMKRDAMLRLILPTEEGVQSGSYLQSLRAFCKSILLAYEECYEKRGKLCIEGWIKDGIQRIIDHPEYCPKLALIFFTLSKEQWLANDFVPQPRFVYDSSGVPRQVLDGEPKVDPSKFMNYMKHSLIPLTKSYLDGREELDLQKYVRRAAFAWLTTGSNLPVEQQLRFMNGDSSS